MKYILYKLTFSSNKSYIGQTNRTMHLRELQHKRSVRGDSKLAVHCAWRKYGDPDIEIIGEYKSQSELHDAEIQAIEDYETMSPNGYNISYGGDTAPSKSAIVAKKISKKAKGRAHTEETKKVISQNSLEMWQDDEYRKKVSEGLKAAWTGKKKNERSKLLKKIWKNKKAEGWTMPESQKENMRGKVFSEETRKKMSEASKGKPKPPRSKATRKKISENTKQAWQDPELTEARVKAIRKAWTPEARERMAEKARQRWKNPEYRKNVLNGMKNHKDR